MQKLKTKKSVSSTSAISVGRLLLKTISDRLYDKQHKMAACFQRAFERLTPRCKHASVILFSLVLMTTFGCIMAASLKIRSPAVTHIYHIAVPKANRYMNGESRGLYVLDTNSKKKFNTFLRYLDSLSTTESGTIIRDSILYRRPGLIDSITRLKHLIDQIPKSK